MAGGVYRRPLTRRIHQLRRSRRLIYTATGAPTVEQEGFRFYEATSTEGTNPLADQDVNISRSAGSTTRLRVLLNTTGDVASTAWKLQFRDPSGTWRDLRAGE